MFFWPFFVFSQEYQLLAPLPGVPATVNQNFATYAQSIITLIIGLSAVLAVLMIMFGGFMYMTGEAINTKEEGRQTMLNAIYGLLLLLACYLILNTINPQLLNLDLKPERSSPTSVPAAPVAPGPGGLIGPI